MKWQLSCYNDVTCIRVSMVLYEAKRCFSPMLNMSMRSDGRFGQTVILGVRP